MKDLDDPIEYLDGSLRVADMDSDTVARRRRWGISLGMTRSPLATGLQGLNCGLRHLNLIAIYMQ